jgi:hypothetical protein
VCIEGVRHGAQPLPRIQRDPVRRCCIRAYPDFKPPLLAVKCVNSEVQRNVESTINDFNVFLGDGWTDLTSIELGVEQLELEIAPVIHRLAVEIQRASVAERCLDVRQRAATQPRSEQRTSNMTDADHRSDVPYIRSKPDAQRDDGQAIDRSGRSQIHRRSDICTSPIHGVASASAAQTLRLNRVVLARRDDHDCRGEDDRELCIASSSAHRS